MGYIKQASRRAGVVVFIKDASRILNRHFIAGERDQLDAMGTMERIKGK